MSPHAWPGRVPPPCAPRAPHPSIQSVQQRVASAVGHAAAPMGLPAFPELEALSTKGTLVDLPIFSSAKRHAVILQLRNRKTPSALTGSRRSRLTHARTQHKSASPEQTHSTESPAAEDRSVPLEQLAATCRLSTPTTTPPASDSRQGRYLHHGGRGLLRHVVDGILVSQPVGALHGVVEVPPPVVLLHVPQGGVDPPLKRQQPRELQQAHLPTASCPEPDSEKASYSRERASEGSHRPADSEAHLLPLQPRGRAQLRHPPASGASPMRGTRSPTPWGVIWRVGRGSSDEASSLPSPACKRDSNLIASRQTFPMVLERRR